MLNGLEGIEGLTPEQVAAVHALAGGLVDKKAELELKLRNAKTLASSEESAQEKLALLESNIESDRLLAKENYSGALTLKEQEYTASLGKLTSEAEADKSLIHKLLVDNGLSAQLAHYDVSKDLMPLIQQALSAQATIVDGQAMVGEQSLSDFMKEWAETPEGKASRVAPGNDGGNGSGGGGQSTGKKMQDMTGVERMALLRDNPSEFNRLKAEMRG